MDWLEGPSTYAGKDCLVRPHWERWSLILGRLHAPGKTEGNVKGEEIRVGVGKGRMRAPSKRQRRGRWSKDF